MKIAYIILCHKNPKQINTLIDELSKNDADVFLHIDLKSNIDRNINKKSNLYILPKTLSYSINWGGNNMILATLNLIRFVKNTGIKYNYICLLSGQDFPIVSYKRIYDFLNSNNGYNFIQVMEKNAEYKKYRKFYELWYPKWITKDNFWVKIIKRVYMIITGGFGYTFNLFKRKKPINSDFYVGSQWWALTSECAYYMLDYCDNNPNYIQYFENTIVPDECFFQTLFMNSPYKDSRMDNLTFVNWKNNERSPYIIRECDFNRIIDNNDSKLFARKFDIEVDKNIINKIINRINGEL